MSCWAFLSNILGHRAGLRPCFQLMSDLHLEVGQQYREFDIPVKALYLILAGDIGRLKDYEAYQEFLQRQCRNFAKVFLVLGNHEFFGTSRANGLELASALEREPGCKGKLHVMNKARVDLDVSNVTLLGCTLHSKIPPNDKLMVQMKVSDFQYIDDWTVDDHNFEHQLDFAWLRHEISSIRTHKPGRKILVITHHAPTIKGSSRPKDAGNPWSSAFATELFADKSLPDVDYWVFGHTHFSNKFKKRRIRLVSNQRGYVLNGVVLGGAKASASQQPLIQQCLMRWKSVLGIDFDVEKLIRV